ncbi:MAG TPA: hypothetical protein VGK42_09970 [Candidatus Dormibacteraeota bacterium]
MTLKGLGGVAALFMLATTACASSGSGSAGQPSPSLSSAISPDTKAADLRVRLDLLLGEHVLVVAKISLAAGGNRPAEYKGYAALLKTNADDLKAVIATAFGASTSARFASIWEAQNGNLVDYTIGQVTHNAKKSSGAISGLVSGFIPQFAQLIASVTETPESSVAELSTEQLRMTRAMIDDQVARNYTKMYVDLRSAHANTSRLGDTLALSIVHKFPDKFPGDPSNKATDLRASLNRLLQEHAYLATMTTGALAAARNAEQAAAQAALAGNAGDLSRVLGVLLGGSMATRFDEMWSAKDAELVIYSGSTDAGRRQNARSDLANTYVSQFVHFVHDATGITESSMLPPTQDQAQATIRVIDDQRSGSLERVAAEDRAAAAAMAVIADLLTTAIVAGMPSKF